MKENGILNKLVRGAALVLDIRPSDSPPSERVLNVKRVKEGPRTVFNPCDKLPKRKG